MDKIYKKMSVIIQKLFTEICNIILDYYNLRKTLDKQNLKKLADMTPPNKPEDIKFFLDEYYSKRITFYYNFIHIIEPFFERIIQNIDITNDIISSEYETLCKIWLGDYFDGASNIEAIEKYIQEILKEKKNMSENSYYLLLKT